MTRARFINAILTAALAAGIVCCVFLPSARAQMPNVTPKSSSPGSGSNAGKLEKSQCTGGNAANCACDADFMNEIYANAYLQGLRQNIDNEVVIRKPDSVLQYSCFGNDVSNFGNNIPKYFSESTGWRSATVPINGQIALVPIPSAPIDVFMGFGRLTNDLTRIITPGLGEFISHAFNHKALGGAASLGLSTGDCTLMNQVFFLAKCRDMEADDMFLSFDDLVNTDPRLLPTACTGGTKITKDMIQLAHNNSAYPNSSSKDFKYVNFDADKSTYYWWQLAPGVDPGHTQCEDPLPTGVMVTRYTKSVDMLGNVKITNTTNYQAKVCPNPSCYYNNQSDKCVQTP